MILKRDLTEDVIQVHDGASLLDIQVQNDQVVSWWDEDTSQELVPIEVLKALTGDPAPEGALYAKTLQYCGLEWHIFLHV